MMGLHPSKTYVERDADHASGEWADGVGCSAMFSPLHSCTCTIRLQCAVGKWSYSHCCVVRCTWSKRSGSPALAFRNFVNDRQSPRFAESMTSLSIHR